jgi:cytochrome c peroxidase
MKLLNALSPSLAGLLAALATVAAPGADLDIVKLRSEAKLMFGVIPDKMPGSEADTPQRVALGKKLYFDAQLSVNKSQSCNTCHRVDENLPGVDNEPTSDGAFGKKGDRNAPTVLNAGFHLAQFWDGRAADLREQAKGPVLNPVEMAMPAEAEVVKRLKADAEYARMFGSAFPDAPDKVTYDNMAEAIAAFERTLKTSDRFDDFQKGDDKALTDKELKGLRFFLDVGCTTCHVGPVIGAKSYQKVGLVNAYENTADVGRFKVTNDEDDKFKFKVPSLRNVAHTWPYFHDGRVMKLNEAVKKMAHLQLGKELDSGEVELVLAFLNTLSDKSRQVKTK